MPVLSADEAAAWRDELERAGRRVVFTSGCFDILHAGHVRYLQQARDLGDALIVALNSDESVRALKGADRPVNNEADRAEVLLGLKSVDAVVIFGEARTTGLIRSIRPHIFAKGGDYTVETLNPEERGALQEYGADITILPELKGRSTSAVIRRMQTPPAGKRRPRLAVIGSGAGSNFVVLADAAAAGDLPADIVLVISDNKDAPILTHAQARGIPSLFIDPGPWKSKFDDAAQKELNDRLHAADVDLVVLAGFMRVLKEPVLSAYAGRIVNVHPSLLPHFPGRAAWDQALEAGVSETGCTVHLVDDSIDGGEILEQKRVPVMSSDTSDTLRLRIQQAEHRLYPAVLKRLCAGLGTP